MFEKMGSDCSVRERLGAVRALGEDCKRGVPLTQEVNNHVHSTYSFSPYTPSMIAVKAATAGLRTVGIMDHDSVSGAIEFLEACKAVNIAATVGYEMRVNMNGTSMEGKKLNNPDEPNIAYIAIHGVPRSRLAKVEAFLEPLQCARLERSRKEVEKLNKLLKELGVPLLDFEADVVSVSQVADGGTITERHILYALAIKLISIHEKGNALVSFVENQMQIPVEGQVRENLLNRHNPHYVYDLLGLFKSALVPLFFIKSDYAECISVHEAVLFAQKIGAIPAYAYLGDVDESPTGDKKSEKFEDDFLEELMQELRSIGFRAITYMPPRNTEAQLGRLQALCRKHGFMEISGVDINSSRQPFNCPSLLAPQFKHLAIAAWALIAHEKLVDCDPSLALFSSEGKYANLTLTQRIVKYADIGRRMNHSFPERAIELTWDL